MNGKKGDHPLTDILHYDEVVYSARADDLVRKIVQLGGRDEVRELLASRFSPYKDPDVKELEAVLEALHARLLADAKERGWEV